jgi:hypothetical protein
VTDKLFESLQNAAGQLPEGWIVELCVERGAGWVDLYDPDGDRHELKEMPDASLAEEVDAAVEEAQRASGLAPSPRMETSSALSIKAETQECHYVGCDICGPHEHDGVQFGTL